MRQAAIVMATFALGLASSVHGATWKIALPGLIGDYEHLNPEVTQEINLGYGSRSLETLSPVG